MTRFAGSLVIVSILLTGCAARELLDPRDGTVPAGVDFSGYWLIQDGSRENDRRIRDAIRRTDGIKDDEIFSGSERQSTTRGSRSKSGYRGGLVFVFLETGKSLKITQTPDGLFISFDRSVVEEFRFGENRSISIGEVEAQRVTGWEGQQLVVDTLDKNGMKMTERLQMLEDGKVLERGITFRSKEGDSETIVQMFDRAN